MDQRGTRFSELVSAPEGRVRGSEARLTPELWSQAMAGIHAGLAWGAVWTENAGPSSTLDKGLGWPWLPPETQGQAEILPAASATRSEGRDSSGLQRRARFLNHHQKEVKMSSFPSFCISCADLPNCLSPCTFLDCVLADLRGCG